MRRVLLDATAAVFTREGYHGLSVELVLEEAKVSRPTFYKYFRSIDEAIDVVLTEINDALVHSVLQAADAATGPYAKIDATLLAFRRWGEQLGPLLRPLFAELHDPHSPTSRHRQRTMKKLAKRLLLVSESFGRPRPSQFILDAVIHGVEFLGYRYHLESSRDEKTWTITRNAMLRLAFGLLATEQEIEHAAPLLRALQVLSPKEER